MTAHPPPKPAPKPGGPALQRPAEQREDTASLPTRPEVYVTNQAIRPEQALTPFPKQVKATIIPAAGRGVELRSSLLASELEVVQAFYPVAAVELPSRDPRYPSRYRVTCRDERQLQDVRLIVGALRWTPPAPRRNDAGCGRLDHPHQAAD